MKIVLAAVAGLLFAGGIYTSPAHAQGVPQGSYLRTCTDVGMRGYTLIARCRRPMAGSAGIAHRCQSLRRRYQQRERRLDLQFRPRRAGHAQADPNSVTAEVPAIAKVMARNAESGAKDCIAKPRNCAIALIASGTRSTAAVPKAGSAKCANSRSVAATSGGPAARQSEMRGAVENCAMHRC